MDAAGYNNKLFDFINTKNIKFYIPAAIQKSVKVKIVEHTLWTPIKFETSNFFWECDAAELTHTLFGGEHAYRMIVLRTSLERKKRPAKWTEIGECAYKILMTNDLTSSINEVLAIYNQRGTREQNFDTLKNDHAWRLPPFSNLNENTVFLLIAAFTNNIYQGLLKNFVKHVQQLNLSMGLKRFREIFVNAICSLIEGTFLYHESDIAYEKIM